MGEEVCTDLVRKSVGQRVLRECDDRIEDQMSEDRVAELQEGAKSELDRILEHLKPCMVAQGHNNMKPLGGKQYCSVLFSYLQEKGGMVKVMLTLQYSAVLYRNLYTVQYCSNIILCS